MGTLMMNRKRSIIGVWVIVMIVSLFSGLGSMNVYADPTPDGVSVREHYNEKMEEAFKKVEDVNGMSKAKFSSVSKYLSGQVDKKTGLARVPSKYKGENGDSVSVPYIGVNLATNTNEVFYAQISTLKLSDVAQAGTSAVIQDEIGDMVSQIDVRPDMNAAADIMETFRDPIETFLGMLCYVIIFGLPIFTAIDIAYMTIPVFQGWSNDQRESGTKGGKVAFTVISKAAEQAVKESNMDEGGKQPMGIYIGKRMWVYILVTIAIWMLIGNNITMITDIAVRLLSGIMGVVGNFGA